LWPQIENSPTLNEELNSNSNKFFFFVFFTQVSMVAGVRKSQQIFSIDFREIQTRRRQIWQNQNKNS
jgi:hypothetical protein